MCVNFTRCISELFSEVFELECRKRVPADVGGILTGLDDPRYTSVWGGLKVAAHLLSRYDDEKRPFDSLIDGLNGVFSKSRRTLKNIKEAIKF